MEEIKDLKTSREKYIISLEEHKKESNLKINVLMVKIKKNELNIERLMEGVCVYHTSKN